MKAADRVLRIALDNREQRPWQFPATFTTGVKFPVEWRTEVETAYLVDGIDAGLKGWVGENGTPYGVGIQRIADLDEVAGKIRTKTAESGGIRNMLESQAMRLSLCLRPIIIVCQSQDGGLDFSRMDHKAVIGALESVCQRNRICLIYTDGEKAGMEAALRAFRFFVEDLAEVSMPGYVRNAAKKEPLVPFTASRWVGLNARLGELERRMEMMTAAGLPARIQLAAEREAEGAAEAPSL